MSDKSLNLSMSGIACPEDIALRDQVLDRILDSIRTNTTIKLPRFDGTGVPGEFALQDLGDNEFSGTVGGYRYQFEGEEDLLHLIVSRTDRQPLTVEEGRQIVAFAIPGVSPAMIWLRPGTYSQHFFFGHDELLASRSPD